jgi:uncharacterized membrane protein
VGDHDVVTDKGGLHPPNGSFWYSRRAAVFFLAFLFVIVVLFSSLIPPFQSPDEFNHIKRAYLLSKGEVFVRSSRNGVTGADIDTGLLNYMQYFEPMPFYYATKMTSAAVASSEAITYSGAREFSELPNTAGYFPLLYLPQALALLAGERFKLTVAESYRLARLCSLMVTLGLLWYSMRLYPVPIMVLALFLTPMSLFQLGSASLDALTFSTSVLIGALFMRGADRTYSFSGYMHAALAFCLLALATSRVYLIALTLLPSVLFRVRRARSYLASTVMILVLSISWIVYVLKTVKDGGLIHGVGTLALDIASYYFEHAGALVKVFFATLSNVDILATHWRMFVGVLGWIDTPLASGVYIAFAVLATGLIVISCPRNTNQLLRGGSLPLTCCAVLSLILLHLIALAMWTPHPATVISGVQGRYFYPIFILLGFSMLGRPLENTERNLALCVSLILVGLAVASAAPRLLSRYWIAQA